MSIKSFFNIDERLLEMDKAVLQNCKEHFAEYWGQRLVNTMRALHDVKYNTSSDDDADTGDTPSGWDNDEFDWA